MKSRMKLVPVVASAAMLLASCVDAKAPPAERPPEPVEAPTPMPVGQEPAGPPTFYNLSDEADRLVLVHLADMTDEHSHVLVPVTILTRNPTKMGLGVVWILACGMETMQISEVTPFGPGGIGNRSFFSDPETVQARVSDENWNIYRLGCDGEANLQRRNTYSEGLTDIIDRFWAQGQFASASPR